MTLYFKKPGNFTPQVIECIFERLKQGDISQVVLATSKGQTAWNFLEVWEKEKSNLNQSLKVIAVTHQAGFHSPGSIEMDPIEKENLQKKNIQVLTTTHALAGIGRAVRKKHGTWQISELIAESLRTFGQGTKVCAEIAMMAADAGLITMDPIIAIGGTGKGADTAWVILPAHTHTYFNMEMRELLCKPNQLHN